MSVNFFLEKGYTPLTKSVLVNEAGTVTVWTPTTSAKVVLTGFAVSSNLAGSVSLYWGNLAGTRIFQGYVTGSGTITSPATFLSDSNVYDRTLHFTSTVSGTGGHAVNLQGFEIPQAGV
mgnify:FL=1